MSIARYIKESADGRDGARSLGVADAHDLLCQVLDRQVTDLEIGAFALAMRIKGESVDELAGFLQAAQERCIAINSQAPHRRAAVVQRLAQDSQSHGVARLAARTARRPRPGARRRRRRCTRHDGGDLPPPRAHSARGRSARSTTPGAGREPAFIRIDALCPPLAQAAPGASGRRRCATPGTPSPSCCRAAVARPCASSTSPTRNTARALAEFIALTRADVLLMRGTEGEPVADARRLQKLDRLPCGQIAARTVDGRPCRSGDRDAGAAAHPAMQRRRLPTSRASSAAPCRRHRP